MKKTVMAGLLVALLPIGAVLAQDAAAPNRKERMEEFKKRFNEADANADGKLTRDEAKDKMPMVYSHFDEMDADKKGYLTLRDIAKAARKMQSAAKSQGAM